MVSRVSSVTPALFYCTVLSLALLLVVKPNLVSAQVQRPNWAGLLGGRAPQASGTNAGSFNWTPEAQAAFGFVRTTLCPTFSLSDLSDSSYPSDVKREVVDAISIRTGQHRQLVVPGLGSENESVVRQAIEQACAPQRIAEHLLDWRYRLGGQLRRPPSYGPLPWPNGAPGILNRMPPALACYADGAAIGVFLSSVPLAPADNGNMWVVPDTWVGSSAAANLAQDTGQRFAPLCRAWYEQQFFAPYFERQHKIDEMRNQYRQIFTAAAPDGQTWVVWETSPPAALPVHENGTSDDLERFYNELNIAWQSRRRTVEVASAVIMPAKDEFEKTVDYQARVEKMRIEAERNAAQTNAAAASAIYSARTQVFNSYFGIPVVTQAIYDADREEMSLTVSSKTSPVRLTTALHLNSDEARALKAQLATAQPIILFTLKRDKLAIGAITIYSDWHIYQGRPVTFTDSPIAFTGATAEQWPRTLAERAEERRVQQVLAHQEESAQIRREAATNPRLAIALNFPLAKDPRCHAVWSNAISLARQRGVTDVTWNQVVSKLTDTLAEMGCLPGQ